MEAAEAINAVLRNPGHACTCWTVPAINKAAALWGGHVHACGGRTAAAIKGAVTSTYSWLT